MKTCFVQAAGTIELYFYGELDEQARRETERHLRTCDECRQALDERLKGGRVAARGAGYEIRVGHSNHCVRHMTLSGGG